VALEECSPDVVEVWRLCLTALQRTRGAFDAWHAVPGRSGVFDPTGLVKGWAVARAARRLHGLGGLGLGWAVNAGGDVALRCADGDPAPWRVGIEDPRDRGRLLAHVALRDGAVATSVLAARGAHIVDPRRGEPVTAVLAATVVGPSLLRADVWATSLVALGSGAVDVLGELHGTSGLVVPADGGTRR
jgi:thiamine biosynthesis lipoprotein